MHREIIQLAQNYKYDVGIQRFYCTYNDNLALLRTVSVNAYDSEGRTIIPFFPISLIDFKAGTSIGTNVQETRKASWNISGRKIYEHLLLNTCQYDYKPPECPVCAQLAACQQATEGLHRVSGPLWLGQRTGRRACQPRRTAQRLVWLGRNAERTRQAWTVGNLRGGGRATEPRRRVAPRTH